VGVGTTLETWHTSYSALQVGGDGALFANKASGTGTGMYMLNNAYYDASDTRWEYIGTDSNEATSYLQYNGAHIWSTAVAGTEDAEITWVEKMRIDSAGLVGIGKTPAAFILDIETAAAGSGVIRAKATNSGHYAGLTLLNDQPYTWNIAVPGTAVTSGAANQMYVHSGTTGILMTFDGGNSRVGIGTGAPAHKLDVVGTAGLSTGTAWTNTSDSRIKTNVQTITGALAKINQLRPVSYQYTDQYLSVHDEIDGTKTYNSFIAEEYETVFPDAVSIGGDLVNMVTPAIPEVKAQEAQEAQEVVLYAEDDEDIPEDKSVGDVRTPAVDATEAVEAVEAKEAVLETLLTELKQYTPHDLTMYLVAAVQELEAKVTALEAA
jgi:hypothetical protein